MATTGLRTSSTAGIDPSSTVWEPRAGTTVRGTVVVLPGRGENTEVYERFGRRIASDGYAVHAIAGLGGPDLVNAIAWLAVDAQSPLVVVGSDTGALEALVATGELPTVVAGVVLAGLPLGDSTGPADWSDELESRSACPVHRGRMEAEIVRGALASTPVPDELANAARSVSPDVPVLIVHGGGDIIAPVDGARALARRLPAARLITVLGGRHDILNDLSHRSVAAEIVQFLERLRASDDAAPILRVEVA